MAQHGHLLRGLSGFTDHLVRKLMDFNVATAEDFVALTAAPEQRRRVGALLDVGEDQLRQLIEVAKASLPESVRREMEEVIDTSQLGLGALKPRRKPTSKKQQDG